MMEPSSFAGATVLIVDDEPMLLELLQRMLVRRGLRVLTAINAADAINIFQHEAGAIRTVITDIMMPDMDGKSLAVKLMEMQPGLNVYVSSGYSGPDDEESLKKVGIAGIVIKPFQSDKLFELIRSSLD